MSMSQKPKDEGLVPLNIQSGLYLRPIARLNIDVNIGKLKLRAGKSLSTMEVMEKLRVLANSKLISLKVINTSLESLLFEAEFYTLNEMEKARRRLRQHRLNLSAFEEPVRMHAQACKFGPSRHDWESYFRDKPDSDESVPGHRPDTLFIQRLPLKWFGGERPDTQLLVDTFRTFGDVKRFYVPLLDEKSGDNVDNLGKDARGFRKFDFGLNSETFDAYIMFKEHEGFANALRQIRGMRLVYQQGLDAEGKPKFLEADIIVDFDRSAHLSDKAIRKRQVAKKYGIRSLEQLNEYKAKMIKRRQLLDERIEKLHERKRKAENVLVYLLRKVEQTEIKERAKEEQKKREEQIKTEEEMCEKLLKKRLQEEEARLREKLLQRKRDQVREQLKQQGISLQSVASQITQKKDNKKDQKRDRKMDGKKDKKEDQKKEHKFERNYKRKKELKYEQKSSILSSPTREENKNRLRSKCKSLIVMPKRS